MRRQKPPCCFCLLLAGAEGFEPSARGFGVDVEKTSADIYQPDFRTVEPFVFLPHTAPEILMIY